MIDRARQAGEKNFAEAPRAKRAEYVENSNELLLVLASGTTLKIPIEKMQGLREAGPDALRDVELTRDGMAVHWNELDAHFTVPGLVEGAYGTKAWMRAIGAKGGKATSEDKQHAARENGKRGGRPGQTSIPDIEPREGTFLVEKNGPARFSVKLVATNGRELLTSPEVDSRNEAIAWTRTIKKRAQKNELQFALQPLERGARIGLYDAEDHLLGTSRKYSAKSTASRAKTTIASTILGAMLEADEGDMRSARERRKIRP